MMAPRALALFLTALPLAAQESGAEAAAKQRLLAACDRLERAEPAALAIAWQGTAGSGQVQAIGNGCVQHVAAPTEWLISARDQLLRVDGRWVGARDEAKPIGCLPGLLAAVRAQPLDLAHREACEIEHRPGEWLTVRIDPANLLDVSSTADRTPSQLRFRIGLPERVVRRNASPVLVVEVAFLIDPGPREVQRIRVRCQHLTNEQAGAAQAGGWREGLPVRPDAPPPACELDIRIARLEVRPLPELDLELRTRLRLPQYAAK